MRNLMAGAVQTIHPEFIIRLTRWTFAAAWRPWVPSVVPDSFSILVVGK
jgi:hypothetical protein